MMDANALRKGVTIELDDALYKVIDYHHHTPGRGLATIKVKARNMRTGSIIEKTFSSSEKVKDVRLDYRQVQFLYTDGDDYIFMDLESYEQPSIPKSVLEDNSKFLTEGLKIKLTFYENEPLDIDLPSSVELKVTEADMAIKGDTATGLNKRVVTESGLEVQVPAFIEMDDVIKVDTRTGDYITRA